MATGHLRLLWAKPGQKRKLHWHCIGLNAFPTWAQHCISSKKDESHCQASNSCPLTRFPSSSAVPFAKASQDIGGCRSDIGRNCAEHKEADQAPRQRIRGRQLKGHFCISAWGPGPLHCQKYVERLRLSLTKKMWNVPPAHAHDCFSQHDLRLVSLMSFKSFLRKQACTLCTSIDTLQANNTLQANKLETDNKTESIASGLHCRWADMAGALRGWSSPHLRAHCLRSWQWGATSSKSGGRGLGAGAESGPCYFARPEGWCVTFGNLVQSS